MPFCFKGVIGGAMGRPHGISTLTSSALSLPAGPALVHFGHKQMLQQSSSPLRMSHVNPPKAMRKGDQQQNGEGGF
jgi:hypothetical protein